MKEVADIHACFVDHDGLYFPLAQKLSLTYKKIDYYDPHSEAFPTLNAAMIGESFPEDERLERIDEYEFWTRKSQYDLYVMPDSQEAGLQHELVSQGKPVWGSQRSGLIEHSRETFIRILKDFGFEVPPFERVIGVSKLCEHLKPRDKQIIKVSRFRGTMETYKWENWDDGEAWLDAKSAELGGFKDLLPFLVFESIDTKFEIGSDTYAVGRKYPNLLLDGTETKDRSYFSALKPMDDLPEQTQAFWQAYSEVLGKTDHVNFVSIEIRVKDDHFYPIDITPRGPLPGSASQMELYANLPTIIAAGAQGELIDPEPAAYFSAECALTMDCKPPQMPSVRVPEKLDQWMKLGGIARVNGRCWFPPLKGDKGNEIGWLVAIGDTPKETIEKLKEYVSMLPPGVEARIDAIAQTLSEIEQAKDEGIVLTDQSLPPPQTVLET
jgi:hypothetical protein